MPCLVLLQFLHGISGPFPALFGEDPWCLPGDCWYRMSLFATVLSATCCRLLAAAAMRASLCELWELLLLLLPLVLLDTSLSSISLSRVLDFTPFYSYLTRSCMSLYRSVYVLPLWLRLQYC